MRAWMAGVGVVLLLGMAGCGGDDGADVSAEATTKARSALRAVEPDLERLATTVQQAEADERSSLVEVQASAQRASEALGDARRDLRDIAELEGLDDQVQRELREQTTAVRDLQELADVLAQPKLSSPRLESAFARAKLAAEDLGTALDVPTFAVDALAQDLRETRAGAERSRRQAAARQAAKRRDEEQTGRPSAPVGGGSTAGGGTSYTLYNGPAFQARIPTGAGWGTPSSSEPTPGQLFRTNVRGPNGLFVIIDFTPFETAKFGGTYSSRTVVGQTAFGAAVRYEFQGGRISECQRSPCVDYIINDASTGRGFAVLAGGGAGSAEIARTVAESVVPVG